MKTVSIAFILILLLPCIASAADVTVSNGNIQAALDSAHSGDTITIPAGTYFITSPLHQAGKSLTLKGEGEVTLNLDVGSSRGMQLEGTLITSQSLSSNAQKGSSTVILSDASAVKKGDLVRIWKNVKWCPIEYPDQTTGELYLVTGVKDNTVTLNEPLLRDYSLSETVKTEVFRPVEIHVENIRFQNKDAAGVREGLALRYCIDSSVTDCWFKDNGQASLRIITSFNVDVKNNEIYNSVHEGNGYGVSVADTAAFVNIENNHIENCRHTIMSGTGDFKALNRGVVITGNTLIGGALTGAQVVDAHPMTIDYLVTKNKIYPKPAYIAFLDGTYQSEFSDNEVYGGYGAVARRGSVNGGVHVIKNNHIESGYIYGGIGSGTSDTLIIKDNYQESCTYQYLFDLNTESFKNIIVSGNTFKNVNAKGIALDYLINGVNLEISNNIFENVKSTAIAVNSNSHSSGDTIIKGNTFTNVGGKISLTGLTASESGSVVQPDVNIINYEPVEPTDEEEEEYEGPDNDIHPLDIIPAKDVDEDGTVITVTGCDGNSDQVQINEAMKRAKSGDTVYLPSGVYWVDGPIYFKSSGVTLKFESDAIIRVSKTDKQWFKGLTGIINSIGYDDITIEGATVDGNCGELDNDLADSSSKTSHDCERAIVIQGSSQNFVSNIIIHDTTIINCFSDGIHVRFAEYVQCSDNFISNCQHDSIYFVCVRYGLMKNNEAAGITADCLRFDNCEYSKAVYNTLFSYSGSNANGAYLHGENGVQAGDQGFSKGGGSNKTEIIHTNNIEIAYNKIINCGLEAILLDAAGLGLGDNVYVHDNEIIGDEEFETSGIPVEILDEIKEVEEGKQPTVEQSKEIFDIIYDIQYLLNLEYPETAITHQTAADLKYTIKRDDLTENGKVAGAVAIIGWNNLTKIDDEYYVTGPDDAIVYSRVIRNPSLDMWSGGIKRIDKSYNITFKNDTAYIKMVVNTTWYNMKTNHVTGKREKGKLRTSTYVFKNSYKPVPKILEQPDKVEGIVYQYPAHFEMKVSKIGLKDITYTTKNGTSKHIFMVGTRNTTEAGVKFTEYERLEYWTDEGTSIHTGDWITLSGRYSKENIKVTASSPYREYEDIEFKIVEKELPVDTIKWWFYPYLVFWGALLLTIGSLWRRLKNMFGFY